LEELWEDYYDKNAYRVNSGGDIAGGLFPARIYPAAANHDDDHH